MKVISTKQFFSLVFFFSLFSIMTSCNKKEINTNYRIVIAGKIINYQDNSKIQYIEFIFPKILNDNETTLCNIDKSGSFLFETKVFYSTDFMIKYGNHARLFISPGDSIFLEINQEFLTGEKSTRITEKNIRVLGSNSKMNNDMLHYYFYTEILDTDYEDFLALQKLEPLAYRNYIEKQTLLKNQNLKDFMLEYSSCERFNKWAKYHIQYASYTELLDYRTIHPRLNGIQFDSLGLLTFKIPKSYFSFLDNPKIYNKKAFLTSNYHTFMRDYSLYLQNDLTNRDTNIMAIRLWRSGNKLAYFQLKKNLIIQKTTGFSRDYSLANLYSRIIRNSTSKIYKKLSNFPAIEDKLLQEILMGEYNKSHPKLAKQNTENIVREIETPAFDSIVNNYKGQVIYVDFWAPWCIPCIEQLPYAKKLYTAYNTNEIIFLYLANNCKEDSWKTTIKKNKIEGIHYLLNDNQFLELRKKYNFSGIPHYMLINKRGNIIDANALAPFYENDLKAIIDKLLDENS